MDSIGNRIKSLREKSGLSAKELAEKLEVSKSTLSKLENDKKSIDAEEVRNLVNVFSVSADYILGIQYKEDIVFYMKSDKHLSDEDIGEVEVIFSRMDEAVRLSEMKQRLQKEKIYVR
jgi:transcriptional regulator with XRE-family HTH domain